MYMHGIEAFTALEHTKHNLRITLWLIGSMVMRQLSDQNGTLIPLQSHGRLNPIALVVLQGQAAAGVVFVACHPTAASVSGIYFSSFEPAMPSLEARSPDTAAALWELSEKLIVEKTATQ